eukprot:CAMPEP_0179726010 /NCGR_PEP_ID=MMETSP0938-20121108/6851_1 /TAXON_ID=548131 ORGANISM="Ostreococcus mediterraneus, Strain clade-D-RCC1107" /NCGR_SAMPLE_ID=MMETSP0938 /ASSEMBLY_ACC=CAM_ASM_000576 /LENGTH=55 /DNA_ID=CAMNT_0021600125 /DNA_START=12 /DNA_END=175 /DNA_ORIENTATION=-
MRCVRARARASMTTDGVGDVRMASRAWRSMTDEWYGLYTSQPIGKLGDDAVRRER